MCELSSILFLNLTHVHILHTHKPSHTHYTHTHLYIHRLPYIFFIHLQDLSTHLTHLVSRKSGSEGRVLGHLSPCCVASEEGEEDSTKDANISWRNRLIVCVRAYLF